MNNDRQEGRINCIVRIPFSDIVEAKGISGFEDLIASYFPGQILTDIRYKWAGHDRGEWMDHDQGERKGDGSPEDYVYIKVTADTE